MVAILQKPQVSAREVVIISLVWRGVRHLKTTQSSGLLSSEVKEVQGQYRGCPYRYLRRVQPGKELSHGCLCYRGVRY